MRRCINVGTMIKTSDKKYRKTTTGIQIAVWLTVFIAPLTFFDSDDRFEPDKLIPMFSSPLLMMAVFYTMYLYLTPKYLFNDDKKRFWIYSVLLVITAGIGLHLWLTFSHDHFFKPETAERMIRQAKHFRPKRRHLDLWFMLRNTFNMAVAVSIAAMWRITMKWHSSETARQEAEVARQEAELKNLRNQINPHFLLNTLNNIYALTAFDTAKAQEAIMELSGMMRHVLYDNQQEFVKLEDEIKFIHSYINLMKIRVSKTCTITENVDIPEHCQLMVAPLIFISLIENAFKHGISATGSSFINIFIMANDDFIECLIENSNCPKKQTDRSGHGIGLQQVDKRLRLSYGENFSWEKGTNEDNTIYHSKIIIYDTKLRNN